jgi:hypothetical protein
MAGPRPVYLFLINLKFFPKKRDTSKSSNSAESDCSETLKDQENGSMPMKSDETPTVEMEEVINIVTETRSQAAKNNADMSAVGLNINKLSK